MNESLETRSNRELWDKLAEVHVGSSFYDVPGFLAGASALNEIELAMLGDARGKSVLHLQCHFGLGTLSLARMGAVVTGVDFSTVAIQKARDLNDQLGLQARFITCDVNDLDQHLDDKFDIVFASFGVIGWHADLDRWARIVSHFMKPEGKFFFAEFHPVWWMLGDDHTRVAYSYFKSDVIIEENQKSYADPEGPVLGTSYGWNHSLGEVFQVLESQGLTIKAFKEYDYSPYPSFPNAVAKAGRYYAPTLEHLLPMVYSLTALRC